jgi:hypothetical protein
VTVGSFFIIPIDHLTIFASIALAAGLYFVSTGLYLFVRKSGLPAAPTSEIGNAFSPSGARHANDSSGDSRRSAPDGLSQQVPAPEIIRLESGASASSAREMTQQERIAAALTRAGISKPEAWSAAEVSQRSVAVEENASPATLQDRRDEARQNSPADNLTPPGVRESAGTPAWQPAIMICGGAIIMLLSAYILLVQMHLL